jgi:membrane associated rhomboid family serine protease
LSNPGAFPFSAEDDSLGRPEALFRRCISAVAEDPSVLPLGVGRDHAVLSLSGTITLFVQFRDSASVDPVLRDLIGRVQATQSVCVVVVGGPELSRILEGFPSSLKRPGSLAFHQWGDDGAWWSAPRSKVSRALHTVTDQVLESAGSPAPNEATFVTTLQTLHGRATAEAKDVQQTVARLKASATPVTWGLMAVILGCFGLQYLWGGPDMLALNARMGAMMGMDNLASQPFRVVTYACLHGGLMHAGFGLLILHSLGRMLEVWLGGGRFLALYLLSAVGGGIAAAMFGGGALTLGSSGALWGIMTGALLLAVRPGDLIPQSMAASLKKGLGQTLLLNLAISFVPGISMAGHLGGGVVGAAVIFALLAEPKATRAIGDRALVGLGAAALAGSLAIGWASGTPWLVTDEATHSVVLRDTLNVSIPGYLTDTAAFEAGESIDGLPTATSHTIGDLVRDGFVAEVRFVPRSPLDSPNPVLFDLLLGGQEAELGQAGWTPAGPTATHEAAVGAAQSQVYTGVNGLRMRRLIVAKVTQFAIVEYLWLADGPPSAVRASADTIGGLRQ